jgi:DNA adenine methylase
MQLHYPRAFLRWAGSKRALLPALLSVAPTHFKVYHEPFLGSGALFFHLKPERAYLCDKCIDLIDTYCAIRDDVNSIIRYLAPLKPRKRLFYHIRNNRSKGRFKKASEFIYLNKSCWNGLYRVNSKGQFNVPFGAPRTDYIADHENLRSCSILLQSSNIHLKCCDFEEALKNVKKGDFVYLDPPYVTNHNNNEFIDYNEVLFKWEDQKRLANIALKMARKGVQVIVSNADHNEIISMYEGFNTMKISRTSTIASDPSKRRKVAEILLYN